ncbi:dTDP-4-dehydrorhamnose reductase [Aquabacterium lacunae]|uniref:dTDP-4-dehydrorhamnose reductase n=1 Tax=Aquabacterium lacunae TaxID=2528630 RepID=A0A4Q9GXT9_9BURK|nr:dTDP-4-dehydrorhamnose reductase [Aquabacterium lacunae]TBO30172.1 dTDP-4-dehydrorhamnose reductase [Aquabacterium lacunae]
MKILLLGKGGQVGWELQRALAPLGELIAHDLDTADFTRPDQVAALARDTRADVIVNAAAHTAVDKAESEPDLVRLINATTPAALAAVAAEQGSWLVHYSTDYVFDGSGSTARTEDAPVAPLSVYGQTKLEGEQAITASGCQHLIFRTSWVFGARGGNFAKTMLKLAAEREALKVINDQVGAPTGADLLADITAHALRTAQQRPEVSGLYHLVAGGETTWFDYARFVIEWARARGVAVKVAPDAIAPVPTTEYPTPARRPLNSRLNTNKLQAAFGLRLPHWQAGVERMLTEHLGV